MTFTSSSKVNSAMLSVNCTSEVSVLVRYGASSVDDWHRSLSDSVVVSSSVQVTLEDKTALSLISGINRPMTRRMSQKNGDKLHRCK